MDKLSTPRSDTRVPHGFKLKTMPNGANSTGLRNSRMDLNVQAEKLDVNGRTLAHSTSDKDLQNMNSRPCSVGSNSSQDTVVSAHQGVPSFAKSNYDRTAASTVPRFTLGNMIPLRETKVYPVGYAGHVPGLISGNLHGAPWRDLLTPRSTQSLNSSARLPCTPRMRQSDPAVSLSRSTPRSAPANLHNGSQTARGTPTRGTPRISVDLYCA